jgi:hypothetical protein
MRKRPIKTKKFIMAIYDDTHKDIKRRSEFRGISMTEWVMIAIRERIEKEIDQGVFNEQYPT